MKRDIVLRVPAILYLAGFGLTVTGCHSAFVEAAIHNSTGQTVHLVELDYPSASFGTESLAPGATFRYRFKVIGQGVVKLVWTDAHKQEHSQAGPELQEGEEGNLIVEVTNGQAVWDAQVHRH